MDFTEYYKSLPSGVQKRIDEINQESSVDLMNELHPVEDLTGRAYHDQLCRELSGGSDESDV